MQWHRLSALDESSVLLDNEGLVVARIYPATHELRSLGQDPETHLWTIETLEGGERTALGISNAKRFCERAKGHWSA